MIYKNTKLFYDGRFYECDFRVEGERFVEIAAHIDGEGYDLGGRMVIPGLTDIHFHGCMNADTCDGNVGALNTIARYEMEHGVTQIVPTTMTYSEEILSPIFKACGEYDDRYAILVGIHMEGPYISEAKIGAQNPKYLMKPDVDMTLRLNELSKGKLKIISVAPEVEGAIEYARTLGDKFIISIAHTDADYDKAVEAYNNGFSHTTHMYNAMNGIHHRRPGIIPAALECGASVELITDGIHIHPAVVRMSFKLFGGRLILVSDSMRATGLKDGIYDLGGQAVEVVGNRAVLLKGKAIAGSATNLYDCMRCAISMGVPCEEAIAAASEIPAKRIGISDEMGIIKEGRLANFSVIDDDYNLLEVYVRGEKKC